MNETQSPAIPLDINKIVTELTTKLITNTAGTVISKGKGLFKSFSDDIRLKMEKSYKDYLICAYARYSKAKSFLIRDEATQLYDFYVPLGITCGKKQSNEASIYNFIQKNPFAIIKGSAGSGKSMMMRHLFLNTIEKQEKVPIFVELRRLNDFDGSLLDFIKNSLVENKFLLDSEFIEKALKLGHFAIFLDGFDEISISNHKKIVKEILDLAKNYDKNIIIISSRPDEEFSSWNLFDVWEIAPLTLEQALKLIKKVPAKNIDEETRDKFLKDLAKELFDKHKSFLSNPLLLSIMAITYASSGDVPQKISTFYENAYIALFERHDALKGAFKRDRRCKFDILEFKKVFSAFSVLTFQRLLSNQKSNSTNSLRFPKTTALSFIDTAKEISNLTVDFKTEEFLEDCIKAVCLLIEDGLEITFAHRSFQEYFAALFISTLEDTDTQKELIQSFFKINSNLVGLLFEINPTVVEKYFIIPTIEEIEKEINFKGKVNITTYKKFLRSYFSYFRTNLFSLEKISIFPESGMFFYANFYLFVLRRFNLGTSGDISVSLETSQKIMSEVSRNKRTLPLELVLKKKEFVEILADEDWAFSIKSLETVLKLKDILNKKYKHIDLARRENLLKGLLRRK